MDITSKRWYWLLLLLVTVCVGSAYGFIAIGAAWSHGWSLYMWPILAFGLVAVLVIIVLVIPYLWTRSQGRPAPNPFQRFFLRGEDAGERDSWEYQARAHPEMRDEQLPINVLDLDITKAYGQNQQHAGITVQTVSGATCTVHVYYLESQHAAQARQLYRAGIAHADGMVEWNWTPQQYGEYVGSTQVTAYAFKDKHWNRVERRFEMHK